VTSERRTETPDPRNVRRTRLAAALLIGIGLMAVMSAAIPPARPAQAQNERVLAYELVDFSGGRDLVLARAAPIDLDSFPIVPQTVGRSASIARHGQHLARDPHVLSKVGDCNSNDWLYLHPFGEGQYDLGPYGYLQPVIDQYGASMAFNTYAAYNGLNSNAVLDPLWADPSACQPGEPPLACEYRAHNPSVAVIMFGTNDLVVLSPEEFDHYLRRVVVETIEAGIVPLLSTFPRHIELADRSLLFNQIVVRIALDYHIPLMNFWLALEPLPDYGIADDLYHLNGPLTRAGDFSDANNLRTGYPMHNLVTLQALDVLRRALFPVM